MFFINTPLLIIYSIYYFINYYLLFSNDHIHDPVPLLANRNEGKGSDTPSREKREGLLPRP